MFELGARPHPPAQLYRAYLEQSHVFIGIYWQRYGWIAPDETISGLEDEFVRSAGMPRLMYLKEPSPLREERLVEMLDRLADNPEASYRHFATAEELATLVAADLAILLTERFEAARAEPGARSRRCATARRCFPFRSRRPSVGSEVEVARALIRSGARLVTITGTGGVGKTAWPPRSCGRWTTTSTRFDSSGSAISPTRGW